MPDADTLEHDQEQPAEPPHEATAGAPPTIHELMPRVMADIGAIGKGQTNDFHGYQFRGIDDVYNAVNPAMAKHGVFLIPRVLRREVGSITTSRGKTQRLVEVEVAYTFYGPAGDHVEVIGWGEGMDAEDKGTNKAMSAALKYALFQTFLIPTEEQLAADADRGNDPDQGPTQRLAAVVALLREHLSPDEQRVCIEAYQPGATAPDELEPEPLAKLHRALANDQTRAKVIAGVHKRMGADDEPPPDPSPTEGATPDACVRCGEIIAGEHDCAIHEEPPQEPVDAPADGDGADQSASDAQEPAEQPQEAPDGGAEPFDWRAHAEEAGVDTVALLKALREAWPNNDRARQPNRTKDIDRIAADDTLAPWVKATIDDIAGGA